MVTSVVRRRALGLGLPAVVALALLAPATSPAAEAVGEWQLATTDPVAAAAAPAYVGNGYVGTRIPADGSGYMAPPAHGSSRSSGTTPVSTETHIAGVYADKPDLVHGGVQREGSVNLPGWTQLDVVANGSRYAAVNAQRYRQVLDLRRAVVTTTARWSVGGRATDLTYDVTLDRTRMRVGVVRLRLVPRWNGTLQVRDVLGAGTDATPGALHPVAATAGPGLASVVVRTEGVGTTVAEVARLTTPAGAHVAAAVHGAMVTRTATVEVRAGRTYEVEKVVGFATSLDSGSPLAVATAVARAAPAPEAILRDSAAAWARLWRSDILVPGRPALQRRIRAAQFYLLASVRPDVDWSISPVGLSGGGYNDHVFWDAETWMYPALLAQHPGEASTVVDYRYRLRAGARRNAVRTGYGGLRYPWESAVTGDEMTPTWAETGELEQHITADVALAQWQYHLVTGSLRRLRTRGWPVIRGAAEFWASRAALGSDGRFHLRHVEGPDEAHWPVDDSVYTNAAARRTLRIAGRVAQLVGRPAPARWAEVADRLLVLPPEPLGGLPAVRPEFLGYAGQRVKQADVVLLTYPWEYPQAREVDRSDLEYYAARYDPDGPAMTDSVNSIVAAQLGRCSAWTYTRRSVEPFVRAPYEQFTEARAGQGVFTFLTGEGGFLQEFLYGYTGLRWRADRLRLDPVLPPQLSGGLRITGLRWQGRVLDLAVTPAGSTVTLRSGAGAVVESPAGRGLVSVGTPLTVPTGQCSPSVSLR
jgi:trehalose/maltose hydrolase-like predicted phosphorylase